MSKSQIITPYHKLNADQYSLCKFYISQVPEADQSGVQFVGAVTSPTQISPVLLASEQLQILKFSRGFEETELSQLQLLSKYYQVLKKTHPDYLYGESENYFWLLRDFRLNTLSDYLQETKIKEAEANYLILKILDLIKASRSNNIPHGHLSPNNFIINQKELSLVDHLISYISFQNVNLEFMAPEAKAGSLPTMASDLYAFGKIIKYIYRGISCPLPMDLPEQLTQNNPSDRPLIFEVESLVNGIFEREQHATEHWHNVGSFQDPDQKNFDGYLTPELLKKLRSEFSQETKSGGFVKPAESSKPIKELPLTRAPRKKPQEERQETLNRDNNKVFWLIAAALVISTGLYFGLPKSQQIVDPAASTHQAHDSAAYQQTLAALREAQIEPDLAGIDLLKSLSKGQYQRGQLLDIISPDDEQLQQKVKFNALINLLATQPNKVLSQVYQDAENFGLLKNNFDWFDNPILDWNKVSPLVKSFILVDQLPKVGLNLTYLFDLLYHPNPNVNQQATKQLREKIASAYQAAFYLELLKYQPEFKRSEINFLMEALDKENNLQLALISTWLKNTTPKESIIFNLTAKRKKPQKVEGEDQEDFFSFVAARYLKEYLKKMPEDKLQAFKNHHEEQLRIYSK